MDISQICLCFGIFWDCCKPLEPVWPRSSTAQPSSPGWQAAQQPLAVGTRLSQPQQGSAWQRDLQGTVGNWNFSVFGDLTFGVHLQCSVEG